MPVISVVVAVYNGAATLQRCIDSFKQQSYRAKELLIIDGGSKDETVEIVRQNASTVAYWLSEPDRGVYDAWNKALRHATGEWICFLGADDFFWSAGALQHLAAQLPEGGVVHPLVYGQVAVVSPNGSVLRILGEDWGVVQGSLLKHMPIPHPGTLHYCDLFRRLGEFDESFRVAGDYDFFLRALRVGQPAFVPGAIVVGMGYGGISTDVRRLPSILLEEATARRKNGLPSLSASWLRRFARASLRAAVSTILGERVVRRVAVFKGRMSGHRSFWDQPLKTRFRLRRAVARPSGAMIPWIE